jgi:putative endonuclease
MNSKISGAITELIFMYSVYMLRSMKTGKIYIGHTDNLNRRLEEYNTGRGGKYSKQNGPSKLVYSENHTDRSSAAKRELFLKSTRESYEKRKLAGILSEESDT